MVLCDDIKDIVFSSCRFLKTYLPPPPSMVRTVSFSVPFNGEKLDSFNQLEV
jgi:hypothetical protein